MNIKVPPEQKSVNVGRQVPARPSQDRDGDEVDALDVGTDAPNVADAEDQPVADLAESEPALWDSEQANADVDDDEISDSLEADELTDRTRPGANEAGSSVNERDAAVRDRAYQLWLEEGRPDGRADQHWDMASELIAIKESYRSTLLPNPAANGEENATPEPVEEAFIQENLGEFPTLTDQGEEITFPERANEVTGADEAPLTPPRKGRAKRAPRPD